MLRLIRFWRGLSGNWPAACSSTGCVSKRMLWSALVCVFLSALWHAHAKQRPFETPLLEAPLLGRFLHITDMHLDKHYKEHAAVVSQCHRDKPHHSHGGERRSGHWGSQESDCDSPFTLANATFQWLAREWEAEDNRGQSYLPFDFILWTGDSARHDQDVELPREEEEIYALNRYAVSLFESYLPGVPVVPNFGNNDILLHNTMSSGPSRELDEFARIWQQHIPPDQMDVFLRGGYFAKDLIPGRLGVVSLNTLYFYDSNKAVDGCPRRSRSEDSANADPGTLQLEWLVEQLMDFRRRNMQVHIIGHVPPTAGNYFARCFDVYTELVLRFQDTVIGQHFGHMNLDAFFVQESSLAGSNKRPSNKVPIFFKQIEVDLRYDYESLPGNARTDMQYYGVFYEAPSLVPTYLPALRIWTYNTTMEHSNRPVSTQSVDLDLLLDFVAYDNCSEDDRSFDCALVGEDENVYNNDDNSANSINMLGGGRRHRRPKRKHRRRHKKLPRYASSSAPSRSNTFLTPLGYSQWTLQLDKANAEYDRVLKAQGAAAASALPLNYTLEYTTYDASTLWHQFIDLIIDPQETLPPPRHHELPSEHHVPVPKPLLDRHLEDRGLHSPYTCQKDVCRIAKPLKPLTMYGLEDMTLRSVMDLARRLVLDRKMWKTYVNRLYTSIWSE